MHILRVTFLGIGAQCGREGEREREPTAAAIADGVDKKGSGERNVPLVDGGPAHGETWSAKNACGLTLTFEMRTSYVKASWWMVDSYMARHW